jgi:hypothetical protein
MYFADLTPYEYSTIRVDGDAPSLVNFGWLDSGHEFTRAEPSPGLVECLLRMAEHSVAGMRGYHICPFCPRTIEQPWMLLGDRRIYLGTAEIRIRSGDISYVAPNLLPHYVAAHWYRPPGPVLEAMNEACQG